MRPAVPGWSPQNANRLKVLLVGLGAALWIAPTSASAQAPLTVHVGIYVLSLGKLDTSTGSFTVDFFLTLRCDRPCDNISLEFTNGRATFQEQHRDEPAFKTFRI